MNNTPRRANSRPKAVNYLSDEYDQPDYRESPGFLAYAEQIRELMALKGEIFVRDIHEAYGYEKQHFTIDALEYIGCHSRQCGGRQAYSLHIAPEPKRRDWVGFNNKRAEEPIFI